MVMREYLLYLYVESPLHAGAGGTVDGLDLPIQREATTGYPVIWGQSLKGALRQAARDRPRWPSSSGSGNSDGANGDGDDGAGDSGNSDGANGSGGSAAATKAAAGAKGPEKTLVDTLFGPDPEASTTADETDRRAGVLTVGDAQLVAMPVPTLQRTFAWMTTAIALGRLARKYRALDAADIPAAPSSPNNQACTVSGSHWPTGRNQEVLGSYLIPFEQDDGKLGAWAEWLRRDAVGEGGEFDWIRTKLAEDLLLVNDDVAPELLRECTEQSVRVQLTKEKTVADGPFHSEYLPTETILAASLTLRTPSGSAGSAGPAGSSGSGTSAPTTVELERAVSELLNRSLVQIGGDETLGKGLTRCRLLAKEDVT